MSASGRTLVFIILKERVKAYIITNSSKKINKNIENSFKLTKSSQITIWWLGVSLPRASGAIDRPGSWYFGGLFCFLRDLVAPIPYQLKEKYSSNNFDFKLLLFCAWRQREQLRMPFHLKALPIFHPSFQLVASTFAFVLKSLIRPVK